MNTRLLTLLAALFLGACSVSSSDKQWVGTEAPATRFTMMDGDQVALESYRGKTVVVLFWGSWCSRSQQLIRKLETFAAERSGRNDLVIIAASIDKPEKIDEVKATLNDANLVHLTPAYSGNEAYDEAYLAFDAHSLPSVFVINPQGTVIAEGDSLDVVTQNVR